jgi:hypothetical protein
MGQDEQPISKFGMPIAIAVIGGLIDLFEVPNSDVVKLGGFQGHVNISLWI